MTEAVAPDDPTLREFEYALAELAKAEYDLTLFVTGASPLAARAIADVRALCETHLSARYRLHIVDVHQNPEIVQERGVLAAPTLMKDFPLPRRVLVGDLSNTQRVLVALDIEPITSAAAGPG